MGIVSSIRSRIGDSQGHVWDGFKMEELLKCGDFDGLASFCEQEELQV